MTDNDRLHVCEQCGARLDRHEDGKQMSTLGRWVCDVCYRHLALPTHAKLLEQLEELINRHNLKRVVEALVSIAHEKALHLQANWQDEPAARSWKRDAGRLGRIEDKLEN